MEIKDGLLYSSDHEWVKVDGNVVEIGITDFAQKQLGEIVFVEMPAEDDEFSAQDVLGAIESVKAASDVIIPVSGRITEINEELEDNPAMVNESPYEAWIIKVELSDLFELESLMDAAKYKEFTE
ncbi:glycine cleavage system protein GcvH [Mycoplasmatota bacterium WC44]